MIIHQTTALLVSGKISMQEEHLDWHITVGMWDFTIQKWMAWLLEQWRLLEDILSFL